VHKNPQNRINKILKQQTWYIYYARRPIMKKSRLKNAKDHSNLIEAIFQINKGRLLILKSKSKNIHHHKEIHSVMTKTQLKKDNSSLNNSNYLVGSKN